MDTRSEPMPSEGAPRGLGANPPARPDRAGPLPGSREIRGSRRVIGKLSGREIAIPDADAPPMPALALPGVILNGAKVEGFEIGSFRGYPDVRSFRRKFGLLLPATNTSMEHELCSVVANNQGPGGLDGIGLQTCRLRTPRPQLRTEDDLRDYKRHFLGGLRAAVDTLLLAEPH